MIVADGNVDQKELSFLYQLGDEYGVSKADVHDAILSGGNITSFPQDQIGRIRHLYDLIRVALIDENLHEKEKLLLCDYANLFGFNPEIVPDFIEVLLQSARENVPFNDLIIGKATCGV